MIEDEQSQSRREITLLTLGIDAANQIAQRCPAARGYILQGLPESILKADTRLVSRKHDRALHDG